MIRQNFAGMGNVSASSTLPFSQISDLYFTGSNYGGEEQANITAVIKPFYEQQAAAQAAYQAQGAAFNNQFLAINNWLRSVGPFALSIYGGGTANVQYWLIGGALGGPKLNKSYGGVLPSLSQVQSDVTAFLNNANQPSSNVTTSQTPTPTTTASTSSTSGYTPVSNVGTTIVNPASGVYTVSNWNGSPSANNQNRIAYTTTIKDEVDYVKYGMFALVGIGALFLLKKGSS